MAPIVRRGVLLDVATGGERGIRIIEAVNLEELARDGIRQFLFVASPLKIAGRTASPIRPFALV